MRPGPAVTIIAALPREVLSLVRGLTPDPALLHRGIHLYRRDRGVVVTAGMGATRVALAFEAAIALGSVDTVISAGLAGSCSPTVLPGTVVEAGLVIDSRTGERFRSSQGSQDVVLATTASIANVGEKGRLASSYGARVVDMEAAAVARLAGAHGLPFRALKGISDAHDFELASLSRFEGKQGRFRTAAFALHTALRPHHWRHAARLGRESNRALAALAERLEQILADAA